VRVESLKSFFCNPGTGKKEIFTKERKEKRKKKKKKKEQNHSKNLNR